MLAGVRGHVGVCGHTGGVMTAAARAWERCGRRADGKVAAARRA